MERTVDVHGVYGFLGDQPYKGVVDAAFSARPGSFLAADFLSEDTYQILKTKLRREHFFETFLEGMLDTVVCRALYSRRVRLVCNAGALDPLGCAQKLAAHLRGLGVPLKVAAVVGDNLSGCLDELGPLPHIHSGEPMPAAGRRRLIAAAAYIGARLATEGLLGGADIVVAGRMTDAGLTLAGCACAHGWSYEGDPRLLAAGVLAGHLLSCSGQSARPVTLKGADPGEIGRIVYPIARVSDDGAIRILSPTGVTRESVLSQLFYGVPEMHFIDPDIVVDLGELEVEAVSPTEVAVHGVRGLKRPEKLRVLAIYPGEGVTLKGLLQVPLEDLRATGIEGLRRLVASRLRAGGALVRDEAVQMEALGASEAAVLVFLAVHFKQELYAKIGRAQLPSLLVSAINGGYAGLPSVEQDTVIWDSLVERDLVEKRLQVVFL
jgi:acyclic terpene utilization AtuA family protein